MFNLLNINEHLDSDEKVLEFFRPSRLAYLFQYIIHILIFIIALIFTFYGEPSSNLFILWRFINYASEIVLLYAVIILVRLEYRIWSRRYALTNERMLYSRGIFSEEFKSVPYYKVTDVGFFQTLWDKIIDTGTITVDTAGTDEYEIRYRKIRRPLEIKKMINDRQNLTRQKTTKTIKNTKNKN